MLFESLDSFVDLLSTYKYLLLFPASIIEGPIVSIIAGFLCSSGLFNFGITYVVLLFGDIAGDTLYYSIGRFGGRHFIRKWGNYFGLKEEKLKKIENHFQKHAGKTLIFGKTQAIGGIFLVAAGLSKMPYLKFIWLNILGTIPKAIILLIIGFYLGKAYQLINNYFGYYAIITTIALLLAIICFFLLKPKIKHGENRYSN